MRTHWNRPESIWKPEEDMEKQHCEYEPQSENAISNSDTNDTVQCGVLDTEKG